MKSNEEGCDLCYVNADEYTGTTKSFETKNTGRRYNLCPSHYDEAIKELGDPTATKVGRNDPCPCSSGKKYKKCCGR